MKLNQFINSILFPSYYFIITTYKNSNQTIKLMDIKLRDVNNEDSLCIERYLEIIHSVGHLQRGNGRYRGCLSKTRCETGSLQARSEIAREHGARIARA